MARKVKKGRPPLGKISINLRVRPETREELYRLSATEHITMSDYIEAVLIHHFQEIAQSRLMRSSQ